MPHAAAWIPAPTPSDDKYQRGVLGVRTGSPAYPGAAVLGVSAAWRTGVGLIRYVPPGANEETRFGLPSSAAAVLAAHPETVFGAGRCSAWVIGSGTNPETRSETEHSEILKLLRGDDPVVLDAGALGLALENPTAPLILTPHRGEFLRLWQAAGFGQRPEKWPARSRSGRERTPSVSALRSATERLAKHTDATVLLKGSITITATPGGESFVSGPATPWLASAGTGDVLAGILGALLAGHASAVREDPEVLGAIGATATVLHDAAARRAAGDPLDGETGTTKTAKSGAQATTGAAESRPRGGPITAVDVVSALPDTIAELRSTHAESFRARRS